MILNNNSSASPKTGLMCFLRITLTLLITTPYLATSLRAQDGNDSNRGLQVQRIWSQARHSAFTDLIQFQGDLYCTFREGQGHIPTVTPQGNGTIRVIRSKDHGKTWKSFNLISESNIDLRDPKLSVTPDGRLMLNAGASLYEGAVRHGIESRVAFLNPGESAFGELRKVQIPKAIETGSDWLWRPTWHDGWAWGAIVQVPQPSSRERKLHLVKSSNGIRYDFVTTLPVNQPSETTLRFLDDGTMCAMIRRVGNKPVTWIGTSAAPYNKWKFQVTEDQVGGPNFVQLPNGHWIAGGRRYRGEVSTGLWKMDIKNGHLTHLATLPSGGDCSYPGFVVDDISGDLLISYYSSHEGKASIYLARLNFDSLQAETKPSLE